VPQSGTLTAKGRLIHAGKTTGVSLVEVSDEAGRLVAVTSTRCARASPIPVRASGGP
jgi:acyl-coenzyme A thioesterase PaaI-like protein